MNLETKITIYKFTPQVFTLTHSLLQWTVRSTAADCNNLPFKKPWPTPGNGLFFPLFVT